MNLNSEGLVWVHCCKEHRDPLTELWVPRDDGREDIFCIKHPQVHLGYDSDLNL